MDFDGKIVVISGGSRGLGLELARGFAGEGADVVLLARNEGELAQAEKELRRYGTKVIPLSCDVTDRDQVREAVAKVLAVAGRIDVLVNNAGTIQAGPVENMDLEDYQSAMAVHFWGPLYLMREVLPHMKYNRQGRIVNIASIGGKVAVPHLSPYAASKFALVGLSEGLRAELLKDRVYLTTVCPGLMRTGSHLNAYFKGQHRKEFALFAIMNASPLLSTESESAAHEIIEACRYGKAEIIITPQARLLRLANSLFPSLMAETMALVNRVLPRAAVRNGNAAQRGSESRSPIASSILTRSADRAAVRNNETAASSGQTAMRVEDEPIEPTVEHETHEQPVCVCTHPTHFLGRCQIVVNPPEHTCPMCMESHFHRVDDPAI